MVQLVLESLAGTLQPRRLYRPTLNLVGNMLRSLESLDDLGHNSVSDTTIDAQIVARWLHTACKRRCEKIRAPTEFRIRC